MRADRITTFLARPAVLALVLTLLNALKPVVVDDTAYLLFARHIAQHPANPYGFLLFWYDRPEPAMDILLPPVLPSWLAVGIRVVGEDRLLLKLWLFPILWLLTGATASLVRRFVGRSASWAVLLLVLGPGVLPFVNFMLDVPAMAFQLATVAVFLHATDHPAPRWRWVGLAGLLGGLAVQTKYSTLLLPVVVGLIAWRRGHLRAGAGAIGLMLLTFVLVESWCSGAAGQSHFLHHFARKSQNPGSTLWDRVTDRLEDISGLANPLLAHLGLTAMPVAMLAFVWAGCSPRITRGGIGLGLAAVLAVVLVPGRWATITPGWHPSADRTTLAHVVFMTIGSFTVIAGVWAALVLAFRSWFRWRRSWAVQVLFGWFLLEILAYFVLSPFPAGRRVLALTWMGSLILVRLVHRFSSRRSRVWGDLGWTRSTMLAVGGFASGLVMGIDCWDASVEPWVARRAVAIAHEHRLPGHGYAVGHWGFQYTLDRLGVALVVPGQTVLQPGDWLILPDYPDALGFYRPYHGEANIRLHESAVERLGQVQWDDCLAAQTIPTLYGGKVPLCGRKHPRLVVSVYRVRQTWTPQLRHGD